MDKQIIAEKVTGNPAKGIAGLQSDWWTSVAPNFEKSYGSHLHDISGVDFLDMCGFFGTAPIRFDHPKLRSKEFFDEMAKVSTYRPSLSDFWTKEFAHFIDAFRRTATPPHMHHYFFVEGGALAVENSLKAAFDWKVRLNMQKGKISGDPVEDLQPLGTKVICFENAFHGRSGYTMSMTKTACPKKYKYFPKFPWFRAMVPVIEFDQEGNIANPEELKEMEEKAIAQVKDILQQNPDDIAAMIIEPIQCEGGDRHIPKSFFVQLRQLADENDVILIYDEVQVGFGTTGKMWAHEHFGPEAAPDVVTFGKKAQIAGIMANYDKFSRIPENVFGDEDESKGRLNSTWGGNPVDMVRAMFILDIVEEEKLLENATTVGEYALQELRKLTVKYPDKIKNARGLGMMMAIDTMSTEQQGKLWQACYDEHLLVLTCGEQSVRFRPHLDMTKEEVDQMISRLEKGIQKL